MKPIDLLKKAIVQRDFALLSRIDPKNVCFYRNNIHYRHDGGEIFDIAYALRNEQVFLTMTESSTLKRKRVASLIAHGHGDFVCFLLDHYPLKQTRLLNMAIAGGQFNLVKTLIERKLETINYRSVRLAIRHGRKTITEWLVFVQGALISPNIKDELSRLRVKFAIKEEVKEVYQEGSWQLIVTPMVHHFLDEFHGDMEELVAWYEGLMASPELFKVLRNRL